MKEPGDLLLQHRNLTWFDVDKGMFEELALNMGRQIVPPQEHRCPEVLKDMRFLLGQRYAASSLLRPKGAALSLPPGKGGGVRAACTPTLSFSGYNVCWCILKARGCERACGREPVQHHRSPSTQLRSPLHRPAAKCDVDGRCGAAGFSDHFSISQCTG